MRASPAGRGGDCINARLPTERGGGCRFNARLPAERGGRLQV